MVSSSKQALHESFSIITIVLWFFIALYHTISYWNFSKQSKGTSTSISTTTSNSERSPIQSIHLSFILVFLAFVDLLSLLIETYDPVQTHLFCLIIQHGGTISYALFKCVTYLALISRLYESYKGSLLHYNSKHLTYFCAFLITWTVVNIIIGLLFMDTVVDPLVVPVCVISFPWFLPASWVLADLFAIICCSVLFVKPILTLRKQFKSGNQSTENNLQYLKYLAIKQCVLSAIACFTTVLAMVIMGVFSLAPLAIGIDVNVTMVCLILMYRWNKYIVYFCCPQCRVIQDQTELEVTTNNAVQGRQGIPSKTSIASNNSQIN